MEEDLSGIFYMFRHSRASIACTTFRNTATVLRTSSSPSTPDSILKHLVSIGLNQLQYLFIHAAWRHLPPSKASMVGKKNESHGGGEDFSTSSYNQTTRVRALPYVFLHLPCVVLLRTHQQLEHRWLSLLLTWPVFRAILRILDIRYIHRGCVVFASPFAS